MSAEQSPGAALGDDLDEVTFASGVTIREPLDRLTRFLSDEYPYYDGFEDPDPNRVTPLDVYAAAGVNAFIGGSGAARLRQIHQGVAESVGSVLAFVPVDLRISEAEAVEPVVDLIARSCLVRHVQTAVASKILHRKRRFAIPMLDSVVVRHCSSDQDARVLAASDVSDSTRRAALRNAVGVVRGDVIAAADRLEQLRQGLADRGWPLTPLRVHDILVWTELEDRGYYR